MFTKTAPEWVESVYKPVFTHSASEKVLVLIQLFFCYPAYPFPFYLCWEAY
jgi:hypothetical protein